MLEKYVLSNLGLTKKEVVVPPKVGVDFGALKLGSYYLIVSSDPVTGAPFDQGWYALNVCANDVSTSGNAPSFFQVVILLPERGSLSELKRITKGLNKAALSLGATIVGGHTEVTPSLSFPIVCVTGFAFARHFVSASNAKAGDSIVFTKWAGVEGTSIIAYKIGLKRVAKKFSSMLSVVKEAVTAYKTLAVHAMHDCTEGGVIGALYEMSVASKLGFEVYEQKIPVAHETNTLCSAFKLDPLRLIGSGSLLLSVKSGREKQVINALSHLGVNASVIGKFTKGKKLLISRKKEVEINEAPSDEIWKFLKTRST
ncbi:hypothetical protein B9Q01_04740 [Candidatus Marsarchaeota G1 archaeon OSP_D]|uniref:AIR synthase n=1 Tax=Candidatus Marsarchaeota G1 archaeon OSP_D TaxID=1978155 RepID=A0A2R6AAQ6_9ARCH|nr:MAG: hypothetical protein B9Q01_04740 [Candidatus Marsarchaeota G1 archaeon OSP_D]